MDKLLVGSQAVKELYDQGKHDPENPKKPISVLEKTGSESAQDMIDPDLHVHYEGLLDENVSNWLKASPKLLQLVSAPVLISTIDYLMPATEGARGGRQIAPMLRLMTSDLVLDEPDDFGLEDLPALCRLVHWAGLLGSRVLLSSATLPPSLVEALFSAYKAGRCSYLQARGEPSEQSNVIPCAWFDEFNSTSHTLSNEQDFAVAHNDFVTSRIKELVKNSKKKHPCAGVSSWMSAVSPSLRKRWHKVWQILSSGRCLNYMTSTSNLLVERLQAKRFPLG